ncbi:MAG TPA: hypothetical protein VK039_10190, partial [Brevibacterium sp.]|nr:hypothetical protein [Brevibacterium sp.]
MSDPRRKRRLLTADPGRAHQIQQSDGPFDLPDSPDAWDRRDYLRRDAHVLDVGRSTDGSQTFELVPPTTPGAPAPDATRRRSAAGPSRDEGGDASSKRPGPAIVPATSRRYGFGVVVLTQGSRPDDLRRGLDSLLAQRGVDL